MQTLTAPSVAELMDQIADAEKAYDQAREASQEAWAKWQKASRGEFKAPVAAKRAQTRAMNLIDKRDAEEREAKRNWVNLKQELKNL